MNWLRRPRFFETLAGDIRYGLRTLRKSPGFAAVAIVTLALGIGANIAIFSAVNGILLEPLPYDRSSQLVEISAVKLLPGGIVARFTFEPRLMQQVIAQTPAVAESALYYEVDSTLTGVGPPRSVSATEVSGDFFPLLGVRPLLGRPIVPGDVRPGGQPVVVLGYRVWNEMLGRDPGILGRSILLDEKPHTVVGVMPPQFQFGERPGEPSLWTPLELTAGPGAEKRKVDAIERLKPGVSIAQANAQLKTVGDRIQSQLHGLERGAELRAVGLKPQMVGAVQQGLWILLSAVGFVLLIACVNVGSLLLARGWGRRREIAVRLALGATRRRVAAQLVAESILLAFGGALVGLLISVWSVPILRRIAPQDTPRLDQMRIDAHVLWFVLAISVLTGILFGLAPAWQVTGKGLAGGIKESFGGALPDSSGRRPRRLRSVLMVFEVALAVILVVGAALLVRSFAKLTAMPLGLRTDHVLTLPVQMSKSACDPAAKPRELDRCREAIAEIAHRVRATPGVEAAAVAAYIPIKESSISLAIQLEGSQQETGLAEGEAIGFNLVTPGYFATMGIPFVNGRDFEASDVGSAARVAIVNQSFARKFFGVNAIGRHISTRKDKTGNPEWATIVGEVRDSRGLVFGDSPSDAGSYAPLLQADSFSQTALLVRTAANPMPLAAAIERAIWSLDKDAAVTKLETMDQVVSESVAEPRFQTILLGSFGALGLLLALVGVYGVISFGVSQRTREIGLRMALGARPRDVLRAVIGEGMLLTGAGLVCGIAGALGLTRFLRNLLFEITPFDPASFSAVAVLIAGVSLAACWIPARRAMRIEPTTALRCE